MHEERDALKVSGGWEVTVAFLSRSVEESSRECMGRRDEMQGGEGVGIESIETHDQFRAVLILARSRAFGNNGAMLCIHREWQGCEQCLAW